jgi:DNA-binding transcriptional LysR family regulator
VILGFTPVNVYFIGVIFTIHNCDSKITGMLTPNFRTLDLNLLRVLDVVLTERSLTRAARQLAMTQPAVSNAMKRLRDALGDDLVQRSGFGVEPTPRALALWPAVRGALQTLEQTLSPGSFDAAQSDITFVLAMADATAAELMPGLVETIERDAPGISMRVLPLTTRDPRRLLADEHIDLAVGHFPAVLADITAQAQSGQSTGGQGAAFAHDRLYDGQYVSVMRKGHPLAKKPKLSLDQFCKAHHLLVSFSGRPFGFVDEALAGLSRQRRIVLTVNQFFTAGRVVARSDLLTVLPRHFVRVADSAGELVIRELPFDIPIVHVDSLWHRRSTAQPSHRWLRQQVLKAAQQVFGIPALSV